MFRFFDFLSYFLQFCDFIFFKITQILFLQIAFAAQSTVRTGAPSPRIPACDDVGL